MVDVFKYLNICSYRTNPILSSYPLTPNLNDAWNTQEVVTDYAYYCFLTGKEEYSLLVRKELGSWQGK